MVCTMSFFTACSSDDDPATTVWDSYKGGDYNLFSEVITDVDNEDFESVIANFKMNVAKVADNKAKVTLTSNQIAGDIVIPEALIQQDGDSIAITGTGEMVKRDLTKATKATANKDVITISAKIKDSTVKLSMKWGNETFTLANLPEGGVSNILGTWDTYVQWYDMDGEKVDDPDDGEYAEGSVIFNWETSSKDDKIYITEEEGITVGEAAAMARRLANQDFTNTLCSVTFTSDGKITAVYNENTEAEKPVWKVAKDFATYEQISDNDIEVFLNNEKILSTISDAQQKATIKALLESMQNKNGGIDVRVREEGYYMTFYLDHSFVEGLENNTVVQGMIANIKDEDLEGMGALVKTIIGQVKGLLKKTTKFEVGLQLINSTADYDYNK